MKKLFLLIPALVLAIVTNAAVINITPTSPHSSNNLRQAIDAAQTGDIIEMAAGTYPESGNYLAFDGKEVTVRAAEGAEVIIQTVCPVRLSNGAKAEFINVKFDCSTIGAYDYVIVPADDTENKRVVLNGCEFYGWDKDKAMIEATSSRRLAAVTIDNCYFHDCMKSVVFIENTGSIDLSITNSTFANISTASGFSAGVIDSRATSGSFLVDHCTFYNVQAKSTSYAAVGQVKLPAGAVVSNCIFAFSESAASSNRTIRDKVAANNILVYNYTADSGYGMQSDVVKTNCAIGNPLFTDAANGDFSYAGNWVTMELSPARGAATDGSDLGDPRWYSAEVLPNVDFAADYDLLGAKALLTGDIELNESSHIKYKGTSTPGMATWKMHIERQCVINAVADREAGSTSGCTLTLTVYDADGNEVTAISAARSDDDNDINFNGSLMIPGEGDYTIKLTNAVPWSGAILEKITLSYVGGDVQAMPGTTNIDDAWFSAQGTREDGKIDFPDGYIQNGWVKWNVSFAEAANYNVTVNIDNANGHNYTVALYRSESDESPITLGEGGQKSTIGTIELGAMEVPAGSYILKVTNATQYSDAKLISVKFEYAGGAAVDLSKDAPANLLANADAIVSDDWSIEGGKIVHPESKALTGWAKWNVNSADYGNYNVKVNISSDNGHLVRVEIFEDENAAPIYTLDEAEATKYHTGDQEIDLGNVVLDAREYVVKVSNTGEYSHVQIASIVIAYQNGAKQSIPGSITFTDALLSAKAYIENDMLYFAPHDCGTIPDEWAKWNLYVANTDIYQFTVNVTSPNGQKYLFLLKDNNGEEVYKLEHTSSLGSGDKSFTTGLMYLASGDYTLEMRNVYPYSDGHLVSISAAAVAGVLTIDENATDNGVIHDNYRNGNHNIRVIRSIVPDMYNTICLPFDVNSTQLQAIFGSDVELLQMAAATLSGNELTLNFDAVTSIYRGTPYLIKTSKAIVNPIFTEVEIKAEEGSATGGEGFAADFIGNFIKSEVPAGDQNLFLMQDNELFFRQTATPIKGMRAYFHVNVPGAAQAIQRIRIEEAPAVTTGINRVDANGSVKTIENGQLVIIKNGVKYNVMGVKLQ